jgi:two-component system KDP operon response regulator KdpE
MRILAVEDHPVNVALLRAVLESARGESFGDVQLAVASNLAEARDLLRMDSFDSVILDLRLPDGYGLDLLPDVRASASAQAPVIALTANALPADRAQALDAGCAAFLEKPYRPADLLDLLAASTPTG